MSRSPSFVIPMKVTQKFGISKTRRFDRLAYVCSGGEWGVHNHNLSNVVRGLKERVYCVETVKGLARPPRPLPGVFDRLRGFTSQLLKCLGSCHRWSDEQFIASYHGAKKALYERAMSSLTQRPLLRSDGWLKTFVKAEKLNLSKKPDPAPRVIQPRNARYNCKVGPYLKPLEHRIYGAISRVFGDVTVMKGFDSFQQGAILRRKWCRFHNPVAVGLDASRFDQHVSGDALKWEHSIYNAVYRSEELAKLLGWQIDNVGRAYVPDGVVKYNVTGCRMSGDMNTALGNCLIMCALLHTLLAERRIIGEVVNNGDDCVVIVEAHNLDALTTDIKCWFRDFGFTMKVEEPVAVFEQIEFCQMQPVFDGEAWRMVRNPRITLDKDGINLRPGNVPFGSWLSTVGECGLALTNGIPVVQEYYQYLQRCGTGKTSVETTGMTYLRGKLDCKYSKVSTEARVSFWRAFGVPPHIQESIERELMGLDGYDDGGSMLVAVPALTYLRF